MLENNDSNNRGGIQFLKVPNTFRNRYQQTEVDLC